MIKKLLTLTKVLNFTAIVIIPLEKTTLNRRIALLIYLVWFVNRTKPRTALIETALTGDLFEKKNISILSGNLNSAQVLVMLLQL